VLHVDEISYEIPTVPPSLRAVALDWSRAAVGVDHAKCANDDCDNIICLDLLLCPGTVEQACPHHELLCDEHRSDCVDCRIDARAFIGGA
jgi:hypothetical protein